MPYFFRLSSCCLSVTLALSSTAAANPTVEPNNPPLIVRGVKPSTDSFNTPSILTVINASQPQKQTATTATEMLKNVPGVSVTGIGRTNGQNVSIRGYDQYGVLVLIDGIRQRINGAHFNGTFLDPALIKQVSITRSPSTSLVSSGAMGGVIAYQTVNPTDLLDKERNLGFRISSYGASAHHSLGVGMSAFGRTENLDGIIALNTRKVGNIRQSNGYDAPNDEAINSLMLKGT